MEVFSDTLLLAQSSTDLKTWGIVLAAIVVAYIVFLFTPTGRSTRKGLRAMWVIARATSKEAVRQPIFLILLMFGIFTLFLLTFLPFFTFTDDLKMMKDCGLMHILISCLFLAVWTASTSIASEIEGKTAMTLLSKPINRRQFILGKFFGIISASVALWLPLSLTFMTLVYYKVGYDGAESGSGAEEAFVRWQLTYQVISPLLLILMESIVMASISVAISTRLPMAVNIVTCLVIFVVSQLTPMLVAQSADKIEFVGFVAQWIATILPSLWGFDTEAAITTNRFVADSYVVQMGFYTLCYCTVAMLFSFIFFEDRDLA